jgi:hypothetical protein
VSGRDPDIETNLHNWLFLDNIPLKIPVQFYNLKIQTSENDLKKVSNAQLLMMSIALMRRHMLLCIYLEWDIRTRQLHLNWLFQIHIDKKNNMNVKKKKTRRKQQWNASKLYVACDWIFFHYLELIIGFVQCHQLK